MISIPLHQDPQFPLAALAVLPEQNRQALVDRATLAFTMVNLADAAGRRRMIQYPKDAVFGGFTTKFVTDRMKAAFPSQQVVPPLTAKQLRRQEAHEEYRKSFLETNFPSLTNYEQGQWYKRRPGQKREDFVGCRG